MNKESSKGKKLVVCFSTAGLTAEIWTNKQHLMSRISGKENYDVLYIDQGMSTRDIKKAIKEFNFMYFLKPYRNYEKGLKNLSPYFLPLIKGGLLKRLSWRLLKWIVDVKIRRNHYEQVIFWIYQPQAWYFIKNLNLNNSVILYDCVDDFKSQPFYSENKARREELIEIESKLVSGSDIVITTSQRLFKDKSKWNKNTYYVHNVGDFEHFNSPEISLPSDFRYLEHEKTTVVYAGVIDNYKIDLKLIDDVTSRLDYHFLFIGPVRLDSNNRYFKSLSSKSNVSFYGYLAYEKLPSVLHACDIIWLPYQKNEHTEYVFPLKLFEAMATGKYLAARELNSYESYASLFQTFDSADSAVEKLKGWKNNELTNKRIDLARKNSWESRLEKILDILNEFKK